MCLGEDVINPLALAEQLQADYRRFTWTTYPVADPDLKAQLEDLVDREALLWRGPYLSVQPRHAQDITLAELADQLGFPDVIRDAFPRVTRLFTHQRRAIERIAAGRNTVVATGTGSGKTEAFLVPVVAHAATRKHERGIKAIALYPMNALVNDQEDRVRDACDAAGLSYGVYTGGTPLEERRQMRENPPDILLTNYSMLEFLLTRREDRTLFGDGVLRHLVLDEIHTYQGALGTEIACLVRRLCMHVGADGLVCVGLSATVSASGDREASLRRTEQFATNLFGDVFEPGSVIEEQPVPSPLPDPGRIGLPPDPDALQKVLAGELDVDQLRMVLGNPEDSGVLDLLRAHLAQPRTADELIDVLAEAPGRHGRERAALRDEVAGWLLLGAGTASQEGPPVLEAKVHLFIRGLPHLVRCAGAEGHLLLNGASTCSAPGCAAQATTMLAVCLGCGQDYDLERAPGGSDGSPGSVTGYVARQLHADPVQIPDDDKSWVTSHRCVRCGNAVNGSSCSTCHGPARPVFVARPTDSGKPLTECPVCGYRRALGAVQEFTARTAAAITATAFSLHSELAAQSEDPMLRRLLIFADSRQDTAFQAGYIRDRARSVQVRRLIVQVVQRREAAGEPPPSFNSLVDEVFHAGLSSGLYVVPPGGRDAQLRALRVCQWDVLNEIASDDARPPTLERLGLLTVAYPAVEALTAADLGGIRDLLHGASEAAARWFVSRLLDLLRRRGGIGHPLLGTLDASTIQDLQEAGASVRSPGRPAGFSEASRDHASAEVISIGSRSGAARLARIASGDTLSPDQGAAAVRATIAELVERKVLVEESASKGRSAVRLWRIAPQAMEFREPPASLARCRACRAVQPDRLISRRCTTYNCYGTVEPWHGDPDDHEWRLACGDEPLAIEAAEHSGQIPVEERERIEQRFKDGDLNLLVCTQTLELGVDLGQLLAVVLRNVPPRPSNYAQRAGRAGRREERVALVVTFAGGLPHDIYYYEHPVQMISGAIRPPAFLLDNRRVIERHARALALEMCGEDLPSWMGDLVDETGTMIGTEDVAAAMEQGRARIAGAILATARRGLPDTDLPWLDSVWADRIVSAWMTDLEKSLAAYRSRQQALMEEWTIASASPGRDSARTLGRIGAALEAMRRTDRDRAYTLSYLGSVGFLPSYAFPTDTATLILTGHPAELGHDAVRALKDYAPGQVVYARASKWLVDHVDFRRGSLLSAEGTAALPGRNLCQQCETINDPTSATCLACDSEDLLPLRTVPMRAMRARPRDRITADEEQRARTPFDITTHLSAPGTTETWLFERPGLVLQWERGATITMLNKGRQRRKTPADREPFQICDTCGQWWDAPVSPAAKPTAAQKRALEQHAKYCTTGTPRNIILTVDRPADCLQILPDLETAEVSAADLPVFLASARAAFDLGSRLVLEAGEGEVLGFDWPRPDPNDPSRLTRLAVLYEDVPGGAGYLRQLAGRLGEVAGLIVPILDGCTCERSCYACLRSYSNQMEADLLDRRVAAAFLRPYLGSAEVTPRSLPSYADGFDGLPRSPIERRLAVALIEAGAPRGVTQHVLFERLGADGIDRPGTIADFAWPDRKVAVFCDGWEHHSTPEQRAADQAKRDQARAHGWTILAFWGGQIVRGADSCATRIVTALD